MSHSITVGDIICSGYNPQLEQVAYITKNQDINHTSDYHIMLHNTTNLDDQRNYAFSILEDYPDPQIYSFGGLCFYHSMSSSFYLNFSNQNLTNTFIYQLRLSNQPSFEQVNITLQNEVLSSFTIVEDLTQPYLAYISQPITNTSMTSKALHIKSLINPLRTGSRKIDEGVLAVGGSHLQNLYFIQEDTIEVFNLDTLKYSTSKIHTHMGKLPVQIFMGVNDPDMNEYLYTYHSSINLIDIVQYQPSKSNFSQSFNFNTLNVTISGNLSPVAPSISNQRNITTTRTPFEKRDVQPLTTGIDESSDTAFTHSQNQVLNEVQPSGVLLVPASDANRNPPYDFMMLNYQNESDSFTVHSESLNSSSHHPISLNSSTIAGIVVSVLAFIAIIATIFIMAIRKKKRQYRHIEIKPRELNSGLYMSKEALPFAASYQNDNDDNSSQSSSILQETKSIPKEYYDGYLPDIRPLTYIDDKIDYAQLSSEELLQLEPDVQDTLSLFSGSYTSPPEQKVTYIEDGYTTRTFYGTEQMYTVHYFSSRHLATFVRCVHASLRNYHHVIQTERAIVLSEPTPIFHYQYIWITTPTTLDQSLQTILSDKRKIEEEDKVYIVYSLMNCLASFHKHHFVHLSLDLSSFYYDKEWKLGHLNYSYSNKESGVRNITLPLENTTYTAPELLLNPQKREEILLYHQPHVLEAIDVWSLGCIIYAIVTNGLPLFEDENQIKTLATFQDDMVRHIKASIRDHVHHIAFKEILQYMLQFDPSERKSIKHCLAYWNTMFEMNQ